MTFAVGLATVIARDGIAVIVNKDNDVDELTSDQVKAVYTDRKSTRLNSSHT